MSHLQLPTVSYLPIVETATKREFTVLTWNTPAQLQDVVRMRIPVKINSAVTSVDVHTGINTRF